jgi:hypothetical protein
MLALHLYFDAPALNIPAALASLMPLPDLLLFGDGFNY